MKFFIQIGAAAIAALCMYLITKMDEEQNQFRIILLVLFAFFSLIVFYSFFF